MKGGLVLIVDDEDQTRQFAAHTLKAAGYGCVSAVSVREAREERARTTFDLIVCDLSMPTESGMRLVEEIDGESVESAVLIATAIDDPEVAHKAATLGSNGYLMKPFSANELLISADHAIQSAARQAAQYEDEQRTQHRVGEVLSVTRDLESKAREADEQAADLLRPLSEAVGRRDLETGGHIRRIGEFSAMLAEAHGLSGDEVHSIRLAAPMHDVGKVAIPDSVLLKPGRLDAGERELMERHAEIGHDILAGSKSNLLDLSAQIALTHQEKFDGSGYPRGLKGSEIPIAGRIVAVADVYDALTSDRPYRAAMPIDEAIAIMVAARGTHLDPELLDLFLDQLQMFQQIALNLADHSMD
jgi:putative two-component system response regulator